MSGDMKCSRQKHWSEIDQAAKVERLRTELKRITRRCEDLSFELHRLNQHRHLPDGAPATPFPRPGEGCGPQRRNETEGDDVYL